MGGSAEVEPVFFRFERRSVGGGDSGRGRLGCFGEGMRRSRFQEAVRAGSSENGNGYCLEVILGVILTMIATMPIYNDSITRQILSAGALIEVGACIYIV